MFLSNNDQQPVLLKAIHESPQTSEYHEVQVSSMSTLLMKTATSSREYATLSANLTFLLNN